MHQHQHIIWPDSHEQQVSGRGVPDSVENVSYLDRNLGARSILIDFADNLHTPRARGVQLVCWWLQQLVATYTQTRPELSRTKFPAVQSWVVCQSAHRWTALFRRMRLRAGVMPMHLRQGHALCQPSKPARGNCSIRAPTLEYCRAVCGACRRVSGGYWAAAAGELYDIRTYHVIHTQHRNLLAWLCCLAFRYVLAVMLCYMWE